MTNQPDETPPPGHLRRYDDVTAIAKDLDSVAINPLSHKLLKLLLSENPPFREIMRKSANDVEAVVGVEKWIGQIVDSRPAAKNFLEAEQPGRELFEALSWSDYAAIRIHDYVKNAGREYVDQNLRGEAAISNPIRMVWMAERFGTGGARPEFFEDMLHLFRQLNSDTPPEAPSRERVEKWMDRWPSGLDRRIVKLREENRERIIRLMIEKIDAGEMKSSRFTFEPGMTAEEKQAQVYSWWDNHRFHLGFAIRSADLLNEMLGHSLDPDRLKILYRAEKAGIPFFINPYYLSLLHVRVPYYAVGADQALRDYVFYSQELVDEFGHIKAWEKEDIVEPGKPNAAGWILPTKENIHRRYPEVAILIPDTVGRACGGLCSSCQRMYDFQRGHLNFNLDKLAPKESWPDKLKRLLDYFENDSQLCDILITGGDALMSSDRSLKEIFDAILEMAQRKIEANKSRPDGEKYAEISRVRLGTRLPVYLPMRVTDELTAILADFKKRGAKLGIRQFVVQTHFISPMEVTPESAAAVGKLIGAGWTVTNQHVLVAASSRRGHTAKLRKILNDIGVLPYYTFTVKGYRENQASFSPNGRAVQEEREEKVFGLAPAADLEKVRRLPERAEEMVAQIAELRAGADLPFLATDRNVLNLPGVGKSLTFRVIGVTRYGRRILEFDHDATRRHSPVIGSLGKVIIIESKSISEYLRQLADMGEEVADYQSVWGYSLGETEPRAPLYEYPGYDFKVTEELTNFEMVEPTKG